MDEQELLPGSVGQVRSISRRLFCVRPVLQDEIVLREVCLGESQGVDAFGVSWKKGKGFFHPPVGLLSRVVWKVERERAKGVLVAPDWPGSSQLVVVEEKVRMKELILADTVSLVLECPREIMSNTFRGVPKFKFNIYVSNF